MTKETPNKPTLRSIFDDETNRAIDDFLRSPLLERVVVPSPNGGIRTEVRVIETGEVYSPSGPGYYSG